MSVSERIREMRTELLQKAVEDAIGWCSNPEKHNNSKRVSDQYWFFAFAGEHIVNHHDAHKFLVTYQLTRMRNWDKQRVADLINHLVRQSNFEPLRDIHLFAGELGMCIKSKNVSQQTSAASKIAMYAKPKAQVYIWDQLAMRSARLREGATNIHHIYRDAMGCHDYASFAHVCAKAQAFETQRNDFQCALEHFCNSIIKHGGPLSNAPQEFMERRLLDKLMYWEGWFLREWNKKIAD